MKEKKQILIVNDPSWAVTPKKEVQNPFFEAATLNLP